MCQFEGYVNCVHPWDVVRGASNFSDLDAAKKVAHRKRHFVEAFAKSVLPSLRICDLGYLVTDFHSVLEYFHLCLSIKIKFSYNGTKPLGFIHEDRSICHVILIRSNKMQHYAGIYLLQNYSTCFGCPSHPSSGVQKTVTAASGTGHSI